MERIDTHQTVKNLIASGVPEKQAEAITIAINTSGNLATKEDIRHLEITIRGEINVLKEGQKHFVTKAELKDSVAELKKSANDLIKWIVGGFIGSFGCSIAAVIAFLTYYR